MTVAFGRLRRSARAGAVLAVLAGMMSMGLQCPFTGGVVLPGEPITVVLGASATEGRAPFEIGFNAARALPPGGEFDSINWDFDDGVVINNSDAVDIDHVFEDGGTFTVKAYIFADGALYAVAEVDVTILAEAALTAEIAASAIAGNTPLTVQFAATATTSDDAGIASWAWDFGDKGASTQQNPTHTFATDGLRTVRLTVTDTRGRTAVATRRIANGDRIRFTTTKGQIVIALDWANAPRSCQNVMQYVAEGFYEGTIFHRVVRGFVIQWGGFTAQLEPKQTRDPVASESDNGLSNTRETVAMARTSDPDSATSQIYINMADNSGDLDYVDENNPGYTVFGTVVAGMAVAEQIEDVPVVTRNGLENVPVTPITVTAVGVE